MSCSIYINNIIVTTNDRNKTPSEPPTKKLTKEKNTLENIERFITNLKFTTSLFHFVIK